MKGPLTPKSPKNVPVADHNPKIWQLLKTVSKIRKLDITKIQKRTFQREKAWIKPRHSSQAPTLYEAPAPRTRRKSWQLTFKTRRSRIWAKHKNTHKGPSSTQLCKAKAIKSSKLFIRIHTPVALVASRLKSLCNLTNHVTEKITRPDAPLQSPWNSRETNKLNLHRLCAKYPKAAHNLICPLK